MAEGLQERIIDRNGAVPSGLGARDLDDPLRLRPRMTFSACGGCAGSSPDAINSRIRARSAASDITEDRQERGQRRPSIRTDT